MTDPLAVLSRIREARRSEGIAEVERCDLCAEPISDDHDHLVDLQNRSLLCACRACGLLFASAGVESAHYRTVPDRYVVVTDDRHPSIRWDDLQIPVSVAFFFYNSSLDRLVAFYPGPAGATESELALDAWDDMVSSSPDLATLEPDVEALLARVGDDGSVECFIVPIDACYELVGQLRQCWRGFDGGGEAHEALDAFFDHVRERAR
jgi:hypothetical protein